MNAALVKALAKEPDERFASCGAVVDALEGRLKIDDLRLNLSVAVERPQS
jgi:hypothetical protein